MQTIQAMSIHISFDEIFCFFDAPVYLVTNMTLGTRNLFYGAPLIKYNV